MTLVDCSEETVESIWEYFNMANNMIFSVFLTIFIFFNRLLRAKYNFITPAHKE